MRLSVHAGEAEVHGRFLNGLTCLVSAVVSFDVCSLHAMCLKQLYHASSCVGLSSCVKLTANTSCCLKKDLCQYMFMYVKVTKGSQHSLEEQSVARACCFSCQHQMLSPGAGRKGKAKSLPPTLSTFPAAMQQRILCALQSASVLDNDEEEVRHQEGLCHDTRTSMRAQISAFLLE